ncbi:HAMP domain-containing histidine kinase [Paenibacillus sp. GSMTC-2017]|uniref:sensor histidine kinase n=1 Tax=Paenibacillus sp. GSMTC-2017 TaxID=2794350 RepID=UPI0018D70F15|nr:HAMP domain-containing sensor histidine kinase [Paenibacillus sp. GSMTC-2017]MBH5316939.1 HAMP domain-containing histidine kinase [Paenibacillus sp. GSMTC-2017]
MLFVLIALFAIAAILWLSEPSSAVNQRLGALTFSGGTGALAALIDYNWLPQAVQAGANESVQLMIYQLQVFSSLFSYYGIPYFFLLFALSYRNFPLNRALSLFLPLLLLIPIFYTIATTPFYTTQYPITYHVVVWWAAPYIILGTIIVLSKRIPPTMLARTHWIVCFAVLPTVLFVMFMNYILPSMGMMRMWIYNTWIVVVGATIFFGGLFTYGFMGMRVLIDRKRYDSTLRAVTSGTAMLNHAIKNDAGKLRLFGEKMKRHAISTNQMDLLEDINSILSASRHMEEMVQRVHQRTEDIQLQLEQGDLASLVEGTLHTLRPALGNVQLTTTLVAGWQCKIDHAQVSEAITNLIINAVEAMNGAGKLEVTITDMKRELVIEIKDSGPGMNRVESMSIFEPFYTTKLGGNNFGLGLPYAYHVMRKHKGSLNFRSKKGEGTTFYMGFPKKVVQAEWVSVDLVNGGEVVE